LTETQSASLCRSGAVELVHMNFDDRQPLMTRLKLQ